jgi:hypothetical protein
MTTKTPKILVIAGNPMFILSLVARSKKRACEIQFATSCREANALIGGQQFDLVLSEFTLRDGSTYPLAAALTGSSSTLVYSYPLDSGYCWLPAIRSGQSCWGSLAMRPSEFVGFLDDILRDTSLGQIATSDECTESSPRMMAR